MRNAKRAGFTLVELMVAMALTLFVMVILTQAFATSLETFSGMKGIGDMQMNLRTAGNVLRNDLSQDHFEGKRRLSDLTAPGGTSLIVTQPLQAGFFAVMQGSTLDVNSPAIAPNLPIPANEPKQYVTEGLDANQVPSYRAVNHFLYLTVKRKGNRQENFFSTPVQGASAGFFNAATAFDIPGNQLPYYTWVQPGSQFYSSQWAEVVYFLVRTGSTEEPNNPASAIGTPTYSLYRAQFVMVPDSTNVNALGLASALDLTTFAGMSCNPAPAWVKTENYLPGNIVAHRGANYTCVQANSASAPPNANWALLPATGLLFNSPADAALGNRVIPDLTTFSPANARILDGATLLLPNVVSFHVQIMPTGAIGATALEDVPPAAGATYGVYDTTNSPTFGLQAIQVTLRVFDPASRQSRQMTIVQDL